MARIVERAGVGRSTFYEFFDSPEHALADLEQRALRELESALDAAFNEARTPLERVRAIARNWLLALDAHPIEARVALMRRINSELLSPAGKLLHQILGRCVRAARLDNIPWFNSADDASQLAAAAAVETVSRRHLTEPLRDPQRIVAELITKLLR